MFKWIALFLIIGAGVGGVAAYSSSYTQISKQVDLKTMSLKQPDYMVRTWNTCSGTCKNYSSSSSYGSSSYGGK